MAKPVSKKIFFVALLGCVLFLFSGSFILAASDTELDYPQVPGAETPTSIKFFLPKYIKYLFNFSIWIAGLVAFASLVYGGFRYLASAGSPENMSEAKTQIWAGVLGLAILLGSYLLLRTINPELTHLNVGKFEYNKGVILYDAAGCPGADTPAGEEGDHFLRVRRSISDLEGFNGKTASIYFFNSADELEVEIYSNTGWDPENAPSFQSDAHAAGDCITLTGPIGSSIKLNWKIPGVYLYEFANFVHPPDPRLHVANSATFGDFDDKAKSLRILPWAKVGPVWKASKCPGVSLPPGVCKDRPDCCEVQAVPYAKLLAILHEKENYEGDCQIFFEDNANIESTPCSNSGSGPYCVENIRNRASSIHVFKQLLNVSSTGEGVTVFANFDWNEEAPADRGDENKHCGPIKTDDPLWVNGATEIGEAVLYEGSPNESVLGCSFVFSGDNGQISSIKVAGNFVAVLFRKDGRCQVFTPPGDYRLKDDHIGDDEAKYLLVIPVSKDETFGR